jgi:hypothetical protein
LIPYLHKRGAGVPEDIRVWTILAGDGLREIEKEKLNLEARIESWIAKDISIISSDLLVIGKQVQTDFGMYIDLLCLDHNGDTVIIELKRDKTPREITSQALEYASWVKDLSNDTITEIANNYLQSKGSLEDAFKNKFETDLPEVLNERHKMLIVASEIDSSSERIIRYLSETYGVDINGVTFHHFRDANGQELLARIFLIEPSTQTRTIQTRGPGKRKPRLSDQELLALAESNGVGDLYGMLIEGLTRRFDANWTTGSSKTFIAEIDGNRKTVFSLIPGQSNPDEGVRFQVYINRLAKYLKTDVSKAISLLPRNKTDWKYTKDASDDWAGFVGFFRNAEEANHFLVGMDRLTKQLGQAS